MAANGRVHCLFARVAYCTVDESAASLSFDGGCYAFRHRVS